VADLLADNMPVAELPECKLTLLATSKTMTTIIIIIIIIVVVVSIDANISATMMRATPPPVSVFDASLIRVRV
jgi:hypothetical protein